MASKVQYRATGRRKTSVARVYMVLGEGNFLINKRPLEEYFGKKTLEMIVRQPLALTSSESKFDIFANVHGGGITGQAGAIRLGIARALLKSPRILILDDSTSAVDTATEARIRHHLAHVLPDCTKFIIAQRVSSVMEADKILVLDSGQLVGEGTHKELLASNTTYQEIYYSQFRREESIA